MKIAWGILLISAFTDAIITAGTAYMASISAGPVNKQVIILAVLGGLVSAARTIQQALKASPETSAALTGNVSTVVTSTVSKTP